jgi:hypothetical protein
MADSIEAFCRRAIDLVSSIQAEKSLDLLYEKSDIETWANLGLYFAHKLRSAVEYQRFIETGNSDAYQNAVLHLKQATSCWENVSLITSDIYKEVPLQHYNRNKDIYFHWNKVYSEVKDELEWLKNEVD